MDSALPRCVHMIHNEQPQLLSDHDQASRKMRSKPTETLGPKGRKF